MAETCRRIFAIPALLAAVFVVPLPTKAQSSASPARDHRIRLEEASALAARYRDRHPGAVRAGMFHRQIFDQILAQPGATGIRIYHGEQIDSSPALVLVGVDAEGNDLLEELGDFGSMCPPYCGTLDCRPNCASYGLAASPWEMSGKPRDHRIARKEGAALVDRHRKRHPDAIRAGMFHRQIFDQILAQPGSAGVRIYFGEKADGASALVVVGVDAKGNDLLEGPLGDYGSMCPPYCGSLD